MKRCVAISGDTLTIVDSKVFINSIPQKAYKGIQYNYIIKTNGEQINPKAFERLEIYKSDQNVLPGTGQYLLPLTEEKLNILKQFPMVVSIEKAISKKGEYDAHIFPHDSTFKWNNDNFGPLVIPKKGMTIELTKENIILYRRVIDVYEYNDYQEKDGKVYIDGKQVDKYTFKQNYYWMMGDNRHNSADSRSWGFVPEDHIVGKPVMIFYSLNQEKSFPSNIRWSRIFKLVRDDE